MTLAQDNYLVFVHKKYYLSLIWYLINETLWFQLLPNLRKVLCLTDLDPGYLRYQPGNMEYQPHIHILTIFLDWTYFGHTLKCLKP